MRHEFVTLTDLTATILELAGCDPAPAVDSRSLVPLVRGERPQWSDVLVAEFHGHHFPYPQRMIRDERYKLVVNPESVNELYDLFDDPHELLRERGDNFYNWMTPMYEVGAADHDPTLSAFELEAP